MKPRPQNEIVVPFRGVRKFPTSTLVIFIGDYPPGGIDTCQYNLLNFPVSFTNTRLILQTYICQPRDGRLI